MVQPFRMLSGLSHVSQIDFTNNDYFYMFWSYIASKFMIQFAFIWLLILKGS